MVRYFTARDITFLQVFWKRCQYAVPECTVAKSANYNYNQAQSERVQALADISRSALYACAATV